MKSIELVLAGTATAAKHYVVPKEPCRIVGMYVANAVAQAGAATVQIGKEGASHSILTATLTGTGAGDVTEAALTGSVTAEEKAQVFSPTVPFEIAVDLDDDSDSSLGITILYDEYLVGENS